MIQLSWLCTRMKQAPAGPRRCQLTFSWYWLRRVTLAVAVIGRAIVTLTIGLGAGAIVMAIGSLTMSVVWAFGRFPD